MDAEAVQKEIEVHVTNRHGDIVMTAVAIGEVEVVIGEVEVMKGAIAVQ